MSPSNTKEKYVFYHYNPSFAAAIIFIILFFGSTLLHAFQLARKRTWYFIPFLIGGIFESIGYIGRAISSRETPGAWTLSPYIMQSLLILLAPAFFAASIYMVLGRIILLTGGEAHSPIRASWLTKIFVAGDVLSFLTQGAGGGIQASADDNAGVRRGENIITVGLGIQVVFFGVFMCVSGIFHYRIKGGPTSRSRALTVPWERYLGVLYATSACILVRSVFRIIEYVMGSDGVLLGHEVYLYVFDAVLMWGTMVVFNVWHPSQIIEGGGKGGRMVLETADDGYALQNQEGSGYGVRK